MFFKKKNTWTIDAGQSKFFFKIKYLILTCAGDNTFTPGFIKKRTKDFSHCETHGEDFNDIEYNNNSNVTMQVESVEFFYPLNYSLLIFEKRNKKLLNEKFLKCLLSIENSEKTLLINLERSNFSLNNCKQPYANFSAEGKVKMNEEKILMSEPNYTNSFILSSEILFEGQVQLTQQNNRQPK